MTKDKNVPKPETGNHASAADAAAGASRTAGSAPTPLNLPTKATKATRKAPWFRITVMVVFALFYAYDLFEGVSNTFGVVAEINRVNCYAQLVGTNTVTIPWAILIANMLAPLVVFGLSLLIARKRNVGILAIVLLAGLGVVGALTLSFIALSALGG